MNRDAVPCTALAVDLLLRAADWQPLHALYRPYRGVDPSMITQHLLELHQRGFLVAEGTAAAQLDREYEERWHWGPVAGFYHFGVKEPPWMAPQQATAWMHHLSLNVPPVPLFMTNEEFSTVKAFDPPDLEYGVLGVMNRRRSIRSYTNEPIAIDALRDCLFAGLGITGYIDTEVPGSARYLPLKMAPSGGARNPYEAYVYVQNVADLPSGVYHYSAVENSLGLITDTPAISAGDLLVGQHWANDAAAVVLLVANFERTMWKYRHPMAYRAVLIEAGHIGQNILLAAAERGLNGMPTAILSDLAAQRVLGLNWIRQTLVYALIVGVPRPDAFEVKNFRRHHNAARVDRERTGETAAQRGAGRVEGARHRPNGRGVRLRPAHATARRRDP